MRSRFERKLVPRDVLGPLYWNVPVEATETYPKPAEPSRTRPLGQADPPLLGRRPLDRLAYRLHRRPLREVGLPRPRRPALQQVTEVVHEARTVAHALADGPPVAGVRVRGMLGSDRAHPVKARVVGSFAVLELVEPCVVEDK